MSDKKISDLVELTTLAADDVLPVVDADANATKRITGANLSKFPAGVTVPDGGTIGSASDTDAITIDATGNVALSQALQLGDGTAISSLGFDAYRVTSNIASDGVITALERQDDQSFDGVGSGMSVSNGVFTFPTTGVWFIHSMWRGEASDTNDTIIGVIKTPGGEELAFAYAGGEDGSDVDRTTVTASTVFVVNDTATDKIQFNALSVVGGSFFEGDSGRNRTAFFFLRVGDV